MKKKDHECQTPWQRSISIIINADIIRHGKQRGQRKLRVSSRTLVLLSLFTYTDAFPSLSLACACSTKLPGIASPHPSCLLLRARTSCHGLFLLHVDVVYLPSKGELVKILGASFRSKMTFPQHIHANTCMFIDEAGIVASKHKSFDPILDL